MIWLVMEELTCAKCGKKIEGFTQRHVETLMFQHQFKHKNEERVNGKPAE